MLIKWHCHQRADPDVLHAIDLHKKAFVIVNWKITKGNPFSLCGKVLLGPTEEAATAKFGESREGKCKKCFSISRKLLQQQKRRMK